MPQERVGYVRRDAIPRTSAGKFLKSQLRDELAGLASPDVVEPD